MRLIDGDALKEAFYRKMKELLLSTNTPQISNEALSLLCGASLIADAPTIEPERETGEWLPETEDWRNQIIWVECSECGFNASTSYNFCPNCGARMEGGDSHEDN